MQKCRWSCTKSWFSSVWQSLNCRWTVWGKGPWWTDSSIGAGSEHIWPPVHNQRTRVTPTGQQRHTHIELWMWKHIEEEKAFTGTGDLPPSMCVSTRPALQWDSQRALRSQCFCLHPVTSRVIHRSTYGTDSPRTFETTQTSLHALFMLVLSQPHCVIFNNTLIKNQNITEGWPIKPSVHTFKVVLNKSSPVQTKDSNHWKHLQLVITGRIPWTLWSGLGFRCVPIQLIRPVINASDITAGGEHSPTSLELLFQVENCPAALPTVPLPSGPPAAPWKTSCVRESKYGNPNININSARFIMSHVFWPLWASLYITDSKVG